MNKMYRYVAYDQFGARHESTIEAETEAEALTRLRSSDLLPASIRPVKEQSQIALDRFFGRKSVSLSELELFTSELSILLNNGVKIDRALTVLSRAFGRYEMRALVAELLKGVRGGDPLSDCMARRPDVFDRLYINLVELGEASGDLPLVFERLSSDLKFRRELNGRVVQALTYPAVVFFVCLLCIAFVFNFIVPQMSGLFEDAVDLPVYTQFLLGASDWFRRYQFWLLFVCLAAPFVVPRLFRLLAKDFSADALVLRVPILRSLIHFLERVRVNSALALMLESGVSVDRALGLASGSISNSQLRHGVSVARDKVSKGASLSQVLRLTPLFSVFDISLLEVGEESGELAPVFRELADRSRGDLESWLMRLTGMLEPLLILFMGGVVGSVVITMLLSIVSVNDVGF